MNRESTERAGAALFDDYVARRPLDVAAVVDAPVEMADAYAIQAAFMARRAGGPDGFAGYKIAWTTPLMQQRVGASAPGSGRIIREQVHESGASLACDAFERLAIECEVAVRMAKDLPADENVEREQVFDAVGDIMLAFEVIDRRETRGEPSVPLSIAINIHGAGMVLGQPVADWRNLDIPGAVCRLRINDEQVGTGSGADVIGHPVAPVVWLARDLVGRGERLRGGDVVITGSMIAPTNLRAGDRAIVQMDHLGQVVLDVV